MATKAAVKQCATEVLMIKAAVRKRDGQKCVDCGMTNDKHTEKYGRSLHVHRTAPGSEYTAEGCETLCYKCHGSKPKSPAGSLADAPYRITCIRLPRAHLDAIQAFVDGYHLRTNKSAVITAAIEEFMAKEGLWPPTEGKA